MPFVPKAKRSTLQANNETEVSNWAEVPLRETPYFLLLQVLAATMDDALRGENCYITIGTTQDKSAISFTRRDGDVKLPVFAPSMVELGDGMREWLLPF